MAHIKRVIFSLILLFVQIQFSYGQTNNSPLPVHALLNLSHSLENESGSFASFNKAMEHKLWGVFIEMEDRNGELLISFPDKNTIPFVNILYQIRKLSESARYESPLVIRYNGSSEDIQQKINETNLEQELFIRDSIISPEKYFLLVHKTANEDGFQNVRLKDIKFVERGRSIENDSIIYSNANKMGLFVSSIFEDEDNIRYGNEAEILRIYVNTWSNNGLPPVFLEVNSYKKSMDAIINALINFPRISGRVELSDANIGGIGWKEHPNTKTVGNYSFPVINTSNKTVTPVKPGFRFNPAKVKFKDGKQVMEQNFTQIPLAIHEKLMGYYPFDNDIKDITGKNSAKRLIGAKFKQGRLDGDSHLQLFRGDFVELPETKNFKLKNNSLTISVWVKVEEYHSDYLAILCNSERLFRKGLQLALRNEKPYFGFWNMDLAGKTIVKPGTWNHIVGTYNFENKEMSLYLNGKLDTRMGDIYSFIGEGQMFVARASDGHEFNGSVDNLMIWNRALGDKEIEYLYKNKNVSVPVSSKGYRNVYVAALAFIILIISGIFIISKRRRTPALSERKDIERNKQEAKTMFKAVKSPGQSKLIPNQNNIFLFGVFRFYNKKGENITQQFTPKIRDIFILILIYSIQEENGIQSKKLSELLWPDLTEMNAMNNKRVNINRLKNVISDIDGVELIVEKKFYKIRFTEPCFCDFEQLILADKSGEYRQSTLEALSRGKFLESVDQLWADKLKSSFWDKHFDSVIKIIENTSLQEEMRVKAADVILINDPVSELAIKTKVEILRNQGKNKLAEIEFETFCKEYRNYYSEDFGKSLKEL